MLFPQLRGYSSLKVGNKSVPLTRQTLFISLALLSVLILCWHAFSLRFGSSSSPNRSLKPTTLPRYWSMTGGGSPEGVPNFERPEGLKIIALIFYGRPASVSILDCYLKRNLVENGGMLDEVVFIARTTKSEDLAWLDTLVADTPQYSRMNITFSGKDYRSAYDNVQNGTMYIKIDDDIIFFEDTVIPTLVYTRIKHPEYYILSANIVNQPTLSWVHYHLGAVLPYLPEIRPPKPTTDDPIPTVKKHGNWRASELPYWDGPDDFNVTTWESTFKLNRWLPVDPDSNITSDDTPILETTYDAFGRGLSNWKVAAQEHYSFLEHLEFNELYRYKFQQWDYQYARMGIQFVAIMGDDINLAKPMGHQDDEYYFSEVMPVKTGRHAIVDGRSIAAHYSFEPQRDGIATTDILDRYRAYAKENICMGDKKGSGEV